MNINLKYAKNLLIKENYTLVLYDGNESITSTDRGIKPLLDLCKSGKSFAKFSAADKVIGKAAAFIYVLLEVKEIYADVVSEGAIEVFKRFGIKVEYKSCSRFIINRTATDICPMEKAVLNIDTPEDAYIAICRRYELFLQS